MNISPDYEQKVKILKNAIEATKPLGLEEIKVACLAAKEKVNPKMQATVDARALEEACEKGAFGEGVIVEGPLAFDLAVSKEAARIKGFESKVAGETDIMLMPTIEVGNGIGLVAGLILAVLFFNKVRKVKSESNKEHIA